MALAFSTTIRNAQADAITTATGASARAAHTPILKEG